MKHSRGWIPAEGLCRNEKKAIFSFNAGPALYSTEAKMQEKEETVIVNIHQETMSMSGNSPQTVRAHPRPGAGHPGACGAPTDL